MNDDTSMVGILFQKIKTSSSNNDNDDNNDNDNGDEMKNLTKFLYRSILSFSSTLDPNKIHSMEKCLEYDR